MKMMAAGRIFSGMVNSSEFYSFSSSSEDATL